MSDDWVLLHVRRCGFCGMDTPQKSTALGSRCLVCGTYHEEDHAPQD